MVDILGSIKKTFFPSQAEAEKRRIKAFGSPSVGGAAAKIIGGAAAVGVAPYIVGSAAARAGIAAAARKALPAIGKGTLQIAGAAARNPKTAATIAIGTPVLIGALKTAPREVISAPSKITGSLINVGENIGTAAKQPSTGNIYNIFRENPVVAGGLTLGGLGLIGKGIAGAAATTASTIATNKLTETISESQSPLYVAGDTKPQKVKSVSQAAEYPEAGNIPIEAIPTYSNMLGEATSYEQVPDNVPEVTQPTRAVRVYKRRKSKPLNNRPINIRNYNIMAAKNG